VHRGWGRSPRDSCPGPPVGLLSTDRSGSARLVTHQPGVNPKLDIDPGRLAEGYPYDHPVPEEETADPRARAGATKRSRTRAALLRSATELFETRGWADTRMEDIATAAEVSSATAYNHFPTKHAIAGAAYEPVLGPVALRVEQVRTEHLPAVELLCLAIQGTAEAARARTSLTVAFVSAVQEAAALRGGGRLDPEDRNDPRSYVRLPDIIAGVITDAQRAGDLRRFPPGAEIGATMINLLLLRVMNRRQESAAVTAEIVLTFLLGALKPELLVEAGPDGRPFA
jgi:AcrR family transcriptional regulator